MLRKSIQRLRERGQQAELRKTFEAKHVPKLGRAQSGLMLEMEEA